MEDDHFRNITSLNVVLVGNQG